jgi:hypothetical protein
VQGSRSYLNARVPSENQRQVTENPIVSCYSMVESSSRDGASSGEKSSVIFYDEFVYD